MKYCDICHQTYPTEFAVCPRDQNPLRLTTELLQGMVIRGKYEVQKKLGAGGMAAVYLAKHKAFNELRALKVVSSRNLEDQNFTRRFKTEAVVTRKLQHPNAVRVDDLDETEDGRPFIVMEYVEGVNLRSVIQNEGPLPARRALNIAAQAASALAAAHDLGITHRDIKPDNILLVRQPDGSDLVKVLDFGIAKVREGAFDIGGGYTATQTGLIIGTPQYLSPEQAKGDHGDQIDGRADLYSLGIVLYEMVTGQLPFQSQTAVGLLLQHMQTPAPDPKAVRPDLNIPPGLSALLHKALEKDPADRYRSAQEMLQAIHTAQQLPAGEAKTTMILTPEAWGATATGATAVPAPRQASTPRDRDTVYAPPKTQPSARPSDISKSPTGSTPVSAAAQPTKLTAPGRPKLEVEPKGGKGKWIVVMAVLVICALLVLGIAKKMRQMRQLAQDNAPALPVPASNTAPANSAAASSAPDDAAIQTEIQRAIAATEWGKEAAINIAVSHGNVTLSGKAPKHYDADMAGAIAANMNGVKQVHNEIEVPAARDTRATDVAAQQKKQQAELQQHVNQLIQSGIYQRENRQFLAALNSFQEAQKLDPQNSQIQQEIKTTVRAAGLGGNQKNAANPNVPLKFWQVKAMLEAQMGLPRIVGAVRGRGVDFSPTTEQEQTLRDAGANDALIRVIHNNRR
jgi:serine/threonine-protein kinase